MNVSSISSLMTSSMTQSMRSMRPPEKMDPADMAAQIIEDEDADGDGMISIDETRLDSDIFNEIDTDGDGLLTAEEIETDMAAKEEERMAEMEAMGPPPEMMSASLESDESLLSLLETLNQNQASDAYSSQSWLSSMYQLAADNLSITA